MDIEMMIRIAEAPEWDKINEGKTLTPYFVAELVGYDVYEFLFFVNAWKGLWVSECIPFTVEGYLLEVLGNEKNPTD